MPLSPETLLSHFTALGIPTARMAPPAGQASPLSEADLALLSQCGLPKLTRPAYIHYAQGPQPGNGKLFQTLDDLFPKYKGNLAAQAVLIFAKDGSGNLFWINTLGHNQITFEDHDAGLRRYVNGSLRQFMESVLAYERFFQEKELQPYRFLFEGLAAGKCDLDSISSLMAELSAIDQGAFSSPDNYWPSIAWDGIA